MMITLNSQRACVKSAMDYKSIFDMENMACSRHRYVEFLNAAVMYLNVNLQLNVMFSRQVT